VLRARGDAADAKCENEYSEHAQQPCEVGRGGVEKNVWAHRIADHAEVDGLAIGRECSGGYVADAVTPASGGLQGWTLNVDRRRDCASCLA
jgi:hypothetical protein